MPCGRSGRRRNKKPIRVGIANTDVCLCLYHPTRITVGNTNTAASSSLMYSICRGKKIYFLHCSGATDTSDPECHFELAFLAVQPGHMSQPKLTPDLTNGRNYDTFRIIAVSYKQLFYNSVVFTAHST